MKFAKLFACVVSSLLIFVPGHASYEKIHEYTQKLAQQVAKKADAIASEDQDKIIFIDALEIWYDMYIEVVDYLSKAKAELIQQNPADENIEVIDTLQDIVVALAEEPHFNKALVYCFEKIINNPESGPFERYLADQFLNGDLEQHTYFPGSGAEKVSADDDFTVLNLLSADLSLDEPLAEIVSANADVVCFRGVSPFSALNAYNVLKEEYAHFLYVHEIPTTVLIASKYGVDNIKRSDEVFDFAITNAGRPLGHIYVQYKQKGQKFEAVLEKMDKNVVVSE